MRNTPATLRWSIDKHYLLELELLDPVFFFTHHPDGAAAAEALAGELARVLRASRSSQAERQRDSESPLMD